MRLVLCSAPHADTFGYSMPPPGLLRLGGWLRERGFEVALEDLAYRLAAGDLEPGDALADSAATWIETLIEPNECCLGLSTMGATLPIALAIAGRLRARHPQLPILLGGPGCNGVDVPLIERFPFIDAVLRGEGETALAELLDAPTLTFEGRAGFTWRDRSGATRREVDRTPLPDLDALAAPAWDLLAPLEDYKRITGEDDGLVPIDSGRGCAYDCSFCSIGRYWKRRSRCLSPQKLADEIEALLPMGAAKRAYLCHDIFGADRAHALAFAREMQTRRAAGRSLPFEIRARLDHLDDELIYALKSAGCYRVLVGIESASRRIREAANKDLRGLATEDLLQRVVALAAAGITPILSLILGLPGEEREDLIATLDFIAAAAFQTTGGGAQLSLHLVNPQPGCTLGEERAATSREVPGIPPDMALGAGTSAPERALIEAHPQLFSTWHLLAASAAEEDALRKLAALAREVPELLMRYPHTHAALQRLTSKNTLKLFEERQATGFIFESQARVQNNPILDALLEWEQSKLRATARRGPWRQGEIKPAPNAAGLHAELWHEPLQLNVDVAKVSAALIRGEPLPQLETAYLLVGPSPDSPAITTRRISKDLYGLLCQIGEACAQGAPAPPIELLEHIANLEDAALLKLTQLQP